MIIRIGGIMHEEERTFVAIKPDGVKRGFVGEIISRFEKKGYKLIGMKLLQVTEEIAAKHYAEHIGKPFYPNLVKYITSGPIVAMVFQGYQAVQGIRHVLGATDPCEADVGSIRADYSPLMKCNCIHASDSVDSAEREMRIYFDVEKELCTNWKTMMEVVLDGLQ